MPAAKANSFDADELAYLATLIPGPKGGKRKLSDKQTRAVTGMDQDTLLKISSRLRDRLAEPGQPTWKVDLAKHAKSAFSRA